MSRCFICDCSQSADSLYNDGVSIPLRATNNRIVYNKSIDRDICLKCQDEHVHTMNFWRDVDGGEEFNAFPDEEENILNYFNTADQQIN